MKAKSKYLLILAAGFALGISACSKGDNPTPDDDKTDTIPTDNGIFYKVYRVENFRGDTSDSNPETPKATLFYSLELNSPREVKYQKTSTWDIAFSGIFNSFISSNNGSDPKNFGSGSSGTGGILVLKSKFEDVINVPSDDKFTIDGTGIGADAKGDFGNGTGWYLYDFEGKIMGDGSAQKKHVAYTLSDRTIIVRTAKGNYAKFKMISCYKDAFTIDKWFKDTPHMYFTFEYVLVPKGSSKFEIKK